MVLSQPFTVARCSSSCLHQTGPTTDSVPYSCSHVTRSLNGSPAHPHDRKPLGPPLTPQHSQQQFSLVQNHASTIGCKPRTRAQPLVTSGCRQPPKAPAAAHAAALNNLLRRPQATVGWLFQQASGDGEHSSLCFQAVQHHFPLLSFAQPQCCTTTAGCSAGRSQRSAAGRCAAGAH